MIICVGCDRPATLPVSEAKYCGACWRLRQEQVKVETNRFELWRIMRTPSAEHWGIAHPEVEPVGEGAARKVGDCFVFQGRDGALTINLYLRATLAWETAIRVILPNGVDVDESYYDLVLDRVLSLTATGFDGVTHWFLTVAFADEDKDTYASD